MSWLHYFGKHFSRKIVTTSGDFQTQTIHTNELAALWEFTALPRPQAGFRGRRIRTRGFRHERIGEGKGVGKREEEREEWEWTRPSLGENRHPCPVHDAL